MLHSHACSAIYRSRVQARFEQVRTGGSGYVHIVILLGKATL